MKKHFWEIISIAIVTALALTTGIAVAANNDEQAVVSAPAVTDLSGEKAEVIAINKDYVETYKKIYDEVIARETAKIDYEAFNEMLLNGTYSKDKDPYLIARKTAEDEAQAKCEEMGLYSVIELTRMENTTYIGWTGTFTVDSIEDTRLYFSTPNSFSCSVGNRTGTIKGNSAYAGNYKEVSTTVTYESGQTSTNTVSGTNQTVSAGVIAKSGNIAKGSYTLNMYNGTGSGSYLLEVAFITLIRA